MKRNLIAGVPIALAAALLLSACGQNPPPPAPASSEPSSSVADQASADQAAASEAAAEKASSEAAAAEAAAAEKAAADQAAADAAASSLAAEAAASEAAASSEAAAAEVRARHVQLEQVLVNLLQNAVQAGAPGGQITLAIATQGPALHLSVTDTGPGVPPALRDTLFQPFVTGKPEGIGLGLAIARDIMRQLGGDLLHEETPIGARFTMVMPAA